MAEEGERMTIKEIIKQWLKDNGYDGLYSDECGCSLEDFNACDECFCRCEPGYFVPNEQEVDVYMIGPKE